MGFCPIHRPVTAYSRPPICMGVTTESPPHYFGPIYIEWPIFKKRPSLVSGEYSSNYILRSNSFYVYPMRDSMFTHVLTKTTLIKVEDKVAKFYRAVVCFANIYNWAFIHRTNGLHFVIVTNVYLFIFSTRSNDLWDHQTAIYIELGILILDTYGLTSSGKLAM